MLLLATGAMVWVASAARGTSLSRSVGATAVEEDAGLPLTVRVSRSRLPLPGAELRAWTGGPALELSRSRNATVTATARFPRRGRRRLAAAALLVTDPLGLCELGVFSTLDDVLVLPRIEPVRFGEIGGEGAISARTDRSTATAEATEVDSLRLHRPETPASRIHWPALARTGTLMERRLVADTDQRPVIAVDPRDPSSAAALDQAVRAAASLCVHLAREGGCALLLPGQRRPVPLDPELHGWPELHARLALLQPDAGAPAVALLARAQVVFWVSAAAGASAALGHVRAADRYLVSPHPQAGRPVHFVVAGCSGQRLERARAEAMSA
jgi:uncharacterized protein (DUF58 family)